jgi:pyrroline-5-carboxylate reductase
VDLAVIGGGAMGEAIIRGVLAEGSLSPQDISVCDINAARLETLKKTYKVKPCGQYESAIKDADVVILAVKPQNLPDLLPQLKGLLKSTQVVLSILAGARIDTIANGLDHRRIIRAMPNTPAQIGAGITVWTAADSVTKKQKAAAQTILSALGREIYVPDEAYIDMATAVSGSGPAYFFYMVEGLTEAAIDIGLPAEIAQELALETALGAALLAKQTGKPPQELRKIVTSPGGTTAAGIAKLEDGKFKELLAGAVAAAHKRAKELGSK